MKAFNRVIHNHFKHGMLTGHAIYFLAVAVEGHGFYAICAGAMLLLTVAAPFFGEEV